MWVTAVLVVPFLSTTNSGTPATGIAHKATLTTGLIIGGEVIFWAGILLVGKELAQSYRQKLSPCYWWRRLTDRRY
jgi:hypothetical protein